MTVESNVSLNGRKLSEVINRRMAELEAELLAGMPWQRRIYRRHLTKPLARKLFRLQRWISRL